MSRLKSLGRIKTHIDLVRTQPEDNIKKMILFLEEDLKNIMPGKESRFRESMTERLTQMLEECKK